MQSIVYKQKVKVHKTLAFLEEQNNWKDLKRPRDGLFFTQQVDILFLVVLEVR